MLSALFRMDEKDLFSFLLRFKHVVVELVGAGQIGVDPGGEGGHTVDVRRQVVHVVRHAPSGRQQRNWRVSNNKATLTQKRTVPLQFQGEPFGRSLPNGAAYLAADLLVKWAAAAEDAHPIQLHQAPDAQRHIIVVRRQ